MDWRHHHIPRVYVSWWEWVYRILQEEKLTSVVSGYNFRVKSDDRNCFDLSDCKDFFWRRKFMKVGIFILIGIFILGVHGLIETSAHEETKKGGAHLFWSIVDVGILCYTILLWFSSRPASGHFLLPFEWLNWNRKHWWHLHFVCILIVTSEVYIHDFSSASWELTLCPFDTRASIRVG